MADKKKERRFIEKALKRPGALTDKVGGAPGENIGEVLKLAEKGGLTGQQARFFLNVLRKTKKKKSLIS